MRPGLSIELPEGELEPRGRLTEEDYDALAEIDVSNVKETDRRMRRGKLIQCRLRSVEPTAEQRP